MGATAAPACTECWLAAPPRTHSRASATRGQAGRGSGLWGTGPDAPEGLSHRSPWGRIGHSGPVSPSCSRKTLKIYPGPLAGPGPRTSVLTMCPCSAPTRPTPGVPLLSPAHPPLLCRGGCDLLRGAKLTGLQPLASTPGFQPEGYFWKIYPTTPVRVVLKHGLKVKLGPIVLLFLVEGVCT